MSTYDVGDAVRITNTFTNLAGTATDPTTITVKVKTPANIETTYVYLTDAAVVRTSTGVYYIDVSLTEAGVWAYRFVGTGTVKAAKEGTFIVDYSHFT